MTSSDSTGSTVGMATSYQSNDTFQRASARAAAAEVIEEATWVIASNRDAGFTFTDYGTGPGASGMPLYNAVVREVRANAPLRALTIVHQDIAGNAWGDLMQRLHSDPDSYLRRPDPPAVLAAVGSFYSRRMPPGSVHLGTSFMAAHWMSRQEVVDVHDSAALLDATGGLAQRAADDAATDWLAFWLSRQIELAPGGALVMRCIGAQRNHDHSTSLEILRMLGEAFQSVADQGMITQAAADDFVLSEYPRTVAQAREPFDDGALPELTLVKATVVAEHDPIRGQYERDGDAAGYAQRLTGFLRAFTETSVRTYLKRTIADVPTVDACVDAIFENCRIRWQADPDIHPFRAWTLTVVARKQASEQNCV